MSSKENGNVTQVKFIDVKIEKAIRQLDNGYYITILKEEIWKYIGKLK